MLVESPELQDCLYCALIYNVLAQSDAKIVLSQYSILTLVALKGAPIYVSWEDEAKGKMVLEIFRDSGTCNSFEVDLTMRLVFHWDIYILILEKRRGLLIE